MQDEAVELAVGHLPFVEEREGIEDDDTDRDIRGGARRNHVAHGEHRVSIAAAQGGPGLTASFRGPYNRPRCVNQGDLWAGRDCMLS